MMAKQPAWLTSKQAAEHLGLPTARAVYQAVRRGELPAHRLGKRLRFRAEELGG
jgi:excisionase family DNA binding protein